MTQMGSSPAVRRKAQVWWTIFWQAQHSQTPCQRWLLVTSVLSQITVHSRCRCHCRLPHAMKQRSDHRPSTTKSTVTIEKIRFDASKLQLYRSTLQHLLHPVFSAPPSQCCLASALQSCIAQAALLSFGRPRGKTLHKSNQKWYDEECKSARAALRNTETEMHEHVAMLKAYKQLLRRKRRAWQAKTQQELCEMASRNPSSFWRQYNERQSHTCSITRAMEVIF